MSAPPLLFATRSSFAAMIDASTKTVDRLIDRGLPTVGRRKALRVDVERAVEWMRAQVHTEPSIAADDAEEAGRRAALRTAARKDSR